MAGWFFILFEAFMCVAGTVDVNGTNVNRHVKIFLFSIMRFIVAAGWYIYTLGYVPGYL